MRHVPNPRESITAAIAVTMVCALVTAGCGSRNQKKHGALHHEAKARGAFRVHLDRPGKTDDGGDGFNECDVAESVDGDAGMMSMSMAR